jgi:hypothetical protein
MGVTWGLWTSPNAQKWANIPCAALGLGLAIVGLGALAGMATTDVSEPVPEQAVQAGDATSLPPVVFSEPISQVPAREGS